MLATIKKSPRTAAPSDWHVPWSERNKFQHKRRRTGRSLRLRWPLRRRLCRLDPGGCSCSAGCFSVGPSEDPPLISIAPIRRGVELKKGGLRQPRQLLPSGLLAAALPNDRQKDLL